MCPVAIESGFDKLSVINSGCLVPSGPYSTPLRVTRITMRPAPGAGTDSMRKVIVIPERECTNPSLVSTPQI